MAPETIIGWDLGGAHLKAVVLAPDGRVLAARQEACPLWLGLEHFNRAMDILLTHLGPGAALARHAVTMTGEMADGFSSRAAGVAALASAFGEAARPEHGNVTIYAAARGWLAPEDAGTAWRDVASANWHATSRLVARHIPHGLFLDIGSTTSDLIPLLSGEVAARGADDATRLANDELLYLGVVRTPVMALAQRAPTAHGWTPLMAELFATTADVFRLTGELDETADQQPAADHGPKTAEASARRLARMVGAEIDPDDLAPWRGLAHYFAGEARHRLWRACQALLSRHALPPDAPVVGAGCGRFLAAALARELGRPWIDIATLAPDAAGSPWLGTCASAWAVAELARLDGLPATGAHSAGIA